MHDSPFSICLKTNSQITYFTKHCTSTTFNNSFTRVKQWNYWSSSLIGWKKKQYFIPAALRKSCLIWTLCAWNAFFHCLILLNYVIARAVQNYQSGMRKSIILLFVCLMFCLVFAYRSVLVLFLFTRMQIEIY